MIGWVLIRSGHVVIVIIRPPVNSGWHHVKVKAKMDLSMTSKFDYCFNLHPVLFLQVNPRGGRLSNIWWENLGQIFDRETVLPTQDPPSLLLSDWVYQRGDNWICLVFSRDYLGAKYKWRGLCVEYSILVYFNRRKRMRQCPEGAWETRGELRTLK